MKERRFRLVTSNLIICAVLGLVLASALFALTPETPAAVEANNAVYEGNPESGRVALMFNVYEGTEYVEEIARLISERGWNTTFFVGGKWAEKNGDTVVRLAAEGFELGNHGYLHRDHAKLDAAGNREEIVITENCCAPYFPTFPTNRRMPRFPLSSHRRREAWATLCSKFAKSSATPS